MVTTTNNRVNLMQVCSLNIEQSRLLQFPVILKEVIAVEEIKRLTESPICTLMNEDEDGRVVFKKHCKEFSHLLTSVHNFFIK